MEQGQGMDYNFLAIIVVVLGGIATWFISKWITLWKVNSQRTNSEPMDYSKKFDEKVKEAEEKQAAEIKESNNADFNTLRSIMGRNLWRVLNSRRSGKGGESKGDSTSQSDSSGSVNGDGR